MDDTFNINKSTNIFKYTKKGKKEREKAKLYKKQENCNLLSMNTIALPI